MLRRICHIGWLAVACLICLGRPASAALNLSVRPVWDGRFLPDHNTELAIVLTTNRADGYQLRIASGNFRLQNRGEIEPGQPLELALPVRPSPDGEIEVDVSTAHDSGKSYRVQLRPVAAPLQVAALTLEKLSPADSEHLQVTPPMLPRTVAGYAAVGRIRIDRGAVSQLNDQQRLALTEYLGQCGSLSLPADALDLLAVSESLAGCGSTQVGLVGQTPLASISAQAFLTPERLRALLGANSDRWELHWLVVASVVYALVLIALPRRVRQPHYVVGLALIATAGTVAAIAWRSPRTDGIAVIQARTGARQGRLSAILRLHGDGLKATSVPIHGRLMPPQALDAADTELVLDTTTTPRFQIAATPPLLGRQDYVIYGTIPLTVRPTLSTQGERMLLANNGPQALPTGVFAYAGKVVAAPALAAGDTWMPDPNTSTHVWTPATGLLREFAGHDQAAWMLPLAPIAAKTLTRLSLRYGWLLIHASEPTR